MFLAVLHLLVFLLPPALTAPCPTSFLRHFKCSFPYPACSCCLPFITVCASTSPVSLLSCFDLSAIPLALLLPGICSRLTASPGLVLWAVSVNTGWVGPNSKDSQGSASASWGSDTSWSPQLPCPLVSLVSSSSWTPHCPQITLSQFLIHDLTSQMNNIQRYV